MSLNVSFTELKDSEDLLRRAKSGDQRAMDEVIKQHQGVARSIVCGYSAPGMEREDLMQYANIGIWQAVNVYVSGKGCFKSLASVIARRYVMTAMKRACTLKQTLLNESSSIDMEEDGECVGEDWVLADSAANPEVIVLSRQDRMDLTQALRHELTDLEYEAALIWATRQSLQDVMDCLGVGKKTADNAIQRVKRKALRIQESMDVNVAEVWSRGRHLPELQRARMRRRAGNSRSKRKTDLRLANLGKQEQLATVD